MRGAAGVWDALQIVLKSQGSPSPLALQAWTTAIMCHLGCAQSTAKPLSQVSGGETIFT